MVLLLEEAEERLDEAAQREAEATAQLEDRQARIEALLLDLSAERDRSTELASELSDETERTFLAQQEIEEREIRLSELAMLVNSRCRPLLLSNSKPCSTQEIFAEPPGLRLVDLLEPVAKRATPLRSALRPELPGARFRSRAREYFLASRAGRASERFLDRESSFSHHYAQRFG